MKVSRLLPAALVALTALAQSSDNSTKGSSVSYPVSLNGIDLLSASAADISTTLSAGNITSLELVDAYIARIEANDRQGKNHVTLLLPV